MKQIKFKDVMNQTIVDVDESCINRIILTTIVNGNLHYYWLDADVTYYGISCPNIYELTPEEAQRYLEASTTDNN